VGVKRKVVDVLEVIPGQKFKNKDKLDKNIKTLDAIKQNIDQERLLDPNYFKKVINKLDLAMKKAAKDLQFEEAAAIRDEIHVLKQKFLLGYG